MSPLEAPPVSTLGCLGCVGCTVLFPTPDTVGCALADPAMVDTFGVKGLGPAGPGVTGLGVEFSLLAAFLLADGPFG